MSIEGIRDAIKTALESIDGLNAYDNAPDSINPPCAYPVPRSGAYDLTAGDNYELYLEVYLFLHRHGDIEESQELLDAYLAPTGANSIKAKLEAADLGSHGDSLRVSGFKDYGGMKFGDLTYIGCKFDVHVVI